MIEHTGDGERGDGVPGSRSAEDHPTVVWDLGNVLIPWDRVAALEVVTGDQREAVHICETVFTMELNDILDAGDDLATVLAAVESVRPGSAPIVESYVEHFDHSLGPIDRDLVAVLAELTHGGVRCVGLSNFSAITFTGVPERYPELALLEGILISGEVGVTKPDAAIFSLCEQRFGLRAPEVLFIDDNRANTVAAAAHGWDTITFTGVAGLRRELALRCLPVRATPDAP